MKNLHHKFSLLVSLLAAIALFGCSPMIRSNAPSNPVALPIELSPTIEQIEANGITIAYESYGSPLID